MIKQYMPFRLKYDEDIEYSIDNGATWNNVAGGTLVEIDPTTIQNGVVSVRTNNNIATLNSDDLEFQNRVWEYINIRNGQTITNLNDVFHYCTIGTLRMANMFQLTDMENCASDGYVDNIFLYNLDVLQNMDNFAYSSKIKYINNLYLPQVNSFNNGLSDSEISIVAGLKFLNNCNHRQLLYGSKVAMLGDLYLKTSYFYRMMSYSEIDFQLYGKLDYKYDGINGLTGTSDHAFRDTTMKFSGMEIFSEYNNINGSSYNYYNSNCEAPFSKSTSLGVGTSIFYHQVPNGLDNHLNPQQIADLQSNKRITIEIPDWLPKVQELSNYTTPLMTNVSFGCIYNLRPLIKKGNELWLCNVIADYNEPDYMWTKLDDTQTILEDNTISYSVNHFKAILTQPNEIIVKNDMNNVVATITTLRDVKSANLNANASILYVVTGDTFTTNTTTDQTPNTFIESYDIATGSIIKNITITPELNTDTVGVWCPYSTDGYMQVVRSKYIVNNGINFVLDETKIYAYNVDTDAIDKEITLTNYGDVVLPFFAEINEFCILNKQNGLYTRVFGA